jgi:hypothetical protein
VSEKSKFSAVLRQKREGKQFEDTEMGSERHPLITEKRKRGRPRSGKRSNPDYEQTTIYIPRNLHDQVRVTLIQEGRNDFSDLVEELLSRWVRTRKLPS